MKAKSNALKMLLAGTVMLAPLPTLAHTGPGTHDSIVMGVAHVFSGVDHLLAMLAVGFWAGQLPRTSLSRILSVTLIALLSGSVAGIADLSIPMAELGIALSLVLFGLAAVAGARRSLGIGLAMVGLFSVLHGYAHGSGLASQASSVLFIAGTIMGSALLLLTGETLARYASIHRPVVLPVGGAAIALMGSFLFAAL
jgi:urease accessory protein